jgi:23S rRNA (cytidine2498-2'-O)-methyltransferase
VTRYPARVALTSEFVFALCQSGAEVALKRETARALPAYAPAYQRPGLVTFRTPTPVTPEVELPLVFARASGMSLGAVRDMSAALERVRALRAAGLEPACLQVVERAPSRMDDPVAAPRAAGSGSAPLGLSALHEAALRSAAPELFGPAALPQPGELVLSVIVGADEPWVLGLHRHRRGRCPHPGGRYPIAVPERAPSRAYAKIEEAIQAFELPVRAGDVALELGAAPGGAALALVQRGVSVIGVDPADMDAYTLGFEGPEGARLRHIQKAMGGLTRKELPEHIDWLLLDVHLAPQVALRTARKVASWFRGSLHGAVLTLKLNDWSFADRLDSFLEQAREMGLTEPRARQLASHRQELCIAGVTTRGQTRLR